MHRLLIFVLAVGSFSLAQKPVWTIAEHGFDDLKAVNELAVQGYRLMFYGSHMAVMKRADHAGYGYLYSKAFIEDHINGCFNQLNAMGAQSFGVAVLSGSTVIFEKEPLPRNHHYLVGAGIVPKDKSKTEGKSDRKTQLIPRGPEFQLLRATPFPVIEVEGEYQAITENQPADPIRFVSVSLYGKAEKITRDMNRLVAEGLRACIPNPGFAQVTFCTRNQSQPLPQYEVRQLKSLVGSETVLNELGAKGFRLLPASSASSYDAKVILEKTSGETFKFRIVPLEQVSREDAGHAIANAVDAGFEPAHIVTIRARDYLVLQWVGPVSSAEGKP